MMALAWLLAVASAVSTSTPLAADPEAACKGTTDPGGREIRGTIVSFNGTADVCEALCCADSAAHPLPIAGMQPQGCIAWFSRSEVDKKTNQSHGQCFMLPGVDRHGEISSVPPLNKTFCVPSDPEKMTPDCSTGTVLPVLGPKPPTPPSVMPKGYLGAEGSVEYVDGAREMLPPSYANGTKAGLNRSTELTTEGWPMMDCQITIFDHRPTHAWAPPMDDPEHRQADYSGTWTLTLQGNATVSLVDPVGITLGEPSYNDASNTMAQPIVFAKGSYPTVQNLLVLKFMDTRALPSSPKALNGTGFTKLRIYRPGYTPPAAGQPAQLFTDNWAALLSIYERTRWMGTTGTNSYTWRCAPPNAASCSVVQWDERHTPNMAFQSFRPDMPPKATPWEHVLLAANELDSDVWINVPLQASSPTVCRTASAGDHTDCIKDDPTSTYEYQLALLFRDGNNFTNNVGLKPHLKIYVEHSNEVWNFGFKQEAMNINFAEWEVLNASAFPGSIPTGKKSNLNALVPDRPDIEERQSCTNTTLVFPPDKPGKPPSKPERPGTMCWGRRRHARRVYEISQTFQKVFGAGSLDHDTGRVRMVYASWGLENNFQTYYNDTLVWLQSEYGDISKFIYAISYAQYFGPHSQNADRGAGGFNYSTATIPEVIGAFNAAGIDKVPMTQAFVALAKQFGVKTASYEGGPGYAVGGEKPGSKGLSTMIEASRDAGMKATVQKHAQLCWQFGWDHYEYFVGGAGAVSEYGCWSATESWADINPGPPKLQGLYELTGHSPDERAAWARDPQRERAQHLD